MGLSWRPLARPFRGSHKFSGPCSAILFGPASKSACVPNAHRTNGQLQQKGVCKVARGCLGRFFRLGPAGSVGLGSDQHIRSPSARAGSQSETLAAWSAQNRCRAAVGFRGDRWSCVQGEGGSGWERSPSRTSRMILVLGLWTRPKACWGACGGRAGPRPEHPPHGECQLSVQEPARPVDAADGVSGYRRLSNPVPQGPRDDVDGLRGEIPRGAVAVTAHPTVQRQQTSFGEEHSWEGVRGRTPSATPGLSRGDDAKCLGIGDWEGDRTDPLVAADRPASRGGLACHQRDADGCRSRLPVGADHVERDGVEEPGVPWLNS